MGLVEKGAVQLFQRLNRPVYSVETADAGTEWKVGLGGFYDMGPALEAIPRPTISIKPRKYWRQREHRDNCDRRRDRTNQYQ